jgi:hypothetical protein
MPSKAKKLIEECKENGKNELSLVDHGLSNFKDVYDLCKICFCVCLLVTRYFILFCF